MQKQYLKPSVLGRLVMIASLVFVAVKIQAQQRLPNTDTIGKSRVETRVKPAEPTLPAVVAPKDAYRRERDAFRREMVRVAQVPAERVSPVPPIIPLESVTEASPIPETIAQHPQEIAQPTYLGYGLDECNYGMDFIGRHCYPSWRAKCQAKYWGYPEEFCERPFGSLVHAQLAAQINNGMAAQMVLYRYDFIPGQASLKPRGEIQLRKMANVLLFHAFPLIIEGTGTAALDQARRESVTVFLASLDCSVTEQQIVTSGWLTRGLSGEEALRIYQNRLKQTESRGLDGSQGGSSSGNETFTIPSVLGGDGGAY